LLDECGLTLELLARALQELAGGFEEMRGNRTALLAFAWFIGLAGVIILGWGFGIRNYYNLPTVHLSWGEPELMLIEWATESNDPQQAPNKSNRL
jgi:hypothetical protein